MIDAYFSYYRQRAHFLSRYGLCFPLLYCSTPSAPPPSSPPKKERLRIPVTCTRNQYVSEPHGHKGPRISSSVGGSSSSSSRI